MAIKQIITGGLGTSDGEPGYLITDGYADLSGGSLPGGGGFTPTFWGLGTDEFGLRNRFSAVSANRIKRMARRPRG